MNTSPGTIDIREIRQISEMRAVEDLQKEIWGINDLEVFPALALIPICEVGGILIGAFDGEALVGFVFGFPGIEDGSPIIHSDMLAVKKSYRSHNLGYRLKLAQRESAISNGIRKITWTFDPLQSVNAHLNFAKLGVTSERYEINYYGETSSPLHQSGTDRLWVSWMIDSERVKERVKAPTNIVATADKYRDATALLAVDKDDEPMAHDEALSEQEVVIQIPGEIDLLTTNNIHLFDRWRAATRHAFVEAIRVGFLVEEFYSSKANQRWAGNYCLRRK